MQKFLLTLTLLSLISFISNAQIDLQKVGIEQEKAAAIVRLLYKPAYEPDFFDRLQLMLYLEATGELIYTQEFKVDKNKEYNSKAKMVGKTLEVPFHKLNLEPGKYQFRCILTVKNSMKGTEDQSLSKNISISKPDYPSFKDQSFKIRRLRITQQETLFGLNSSSKGLEITYNLGWKNTFEVAKEGHTEYFHYVTIEKDGYQVAIMRPDQDKRKLPISLSPHNLTFHLPYRNIALEKGVHKAKIRFWIEGFEEPIYEEKLILEQPDIYDLVIELQSAEVSKGAGDNYVPIFAKGLPDPKWFVKIGTDGLYYSTVKRNSYTPNTYSINTTITNYDKLFIGLYDADVLNDDFLGEYEVKHGRGTFSKEFKNISISKASDLQFHVVKQKRQPPKFELQTVQDYVYKGIKGVQLNCNYQLPYHYTRNKLRVHIEGDSNKVISNIIILEEKLSKHDLRHYGQYSCFIPNYNLQNINELNFLLKANDKVVHEKKSEQLDIPKFLEHQEISQQVGYIHKGISGILYTLQYQVTELPELSELKLVINDLPANTCKEIAYWPVGQEPQMAQDTFCKLPRAIQQKVFVFVPYYAAPKHIHPKFILASEIPEVPLLPLTSYTTEAYERPTQLNDIQIRSIASEETIYTGLAGQLFSFNITVPDNYHSKGKFDISIMANDTAVTQHYFINEVAEAPLSMAMQKQSTLKIFIPYRYMKPASNYTVELKASNEDFLLAAPQTEVFDYSQDQLVNFGLYLNFFKGKKWPEFQYKVLIRNTKTLNTTYSHSNYDEVHSAVIPQKHKPDFPESIPLLLHPKDEIQLVFYQQGGHQSPENVIKTNYEQLRTAKKYFTVSNTGEIKKAFFKIVEK
ncbi:MAG: hypothetical protein GY810_30485 [Aureispira sp.]|nr:hypothetical protein [Aureispira sp.]